MVQFTASKAFSSSTFSLLGMFGGGTTAVADHFLPIGGNRHFHTFLYENSVGQDFAVGGTSSLTMAGFGYLRGTVNTLTAGSFDDDRRVFSSDWVLKGLALDGATLSRIAASSSRADDASLLATIFSGHDLVTLSAGNDSFHGYGGDDRISGGRGNDTLWGDFGNDVLNGGLGADLLYGGAGRDIFDFDTIRDTTVAAAGRDTISGFVRGSDRIDLSSIDANIRVGGNQSFVYHPASARHGYDVWTVKSGADVIVYGDVDGLPGADFSILVKGVAALSSADFIL